MDDLNMDDVENEQPLASQSDEDEIVDSGSKVRADDFEAMKSKFVPPDEYEEIESGQYTWELRQYRSQERKIYSPQFTIGGHPWQILLFPFGNQNVDQVSMYLETGYPKERDDGWFVCAQFALVMWNPKDPTVFTHHQAYHRFNAADRDWGFLRYHDLRGLVSTRDSKRPVMENDEINVTAFVRVVRDTTGVLWHNFLNYNSKAETGYVGLKNQGATCYMNSLLQSLFFTNYFRKAVYQIPTDQDDPLNSIAYALQRLFYHLETSDDAIGTLELTKSFGWDTADAFTQHDVQELNRVLQDNLEGKMKGTAAEHALSDIFVGKMKSYIKCVNVDYESSRIEDFWDIQLNVKGMKDLHASFRDYVQVETMDGENKYFAEGFGLQDAKKGVSFMSFPPVLHLHLMRFEYDVQRDMMVKINDRHEFALEMDLSEYLAPDADRSVTYKYRLHGVLVHAGDLNAGHYYALLKPTKDDKWFKFDDDRVTPASLKEVLEDNYGAELSKLQPGQNGMMNLRQRLKRVSNAYMLVYLREDQIDKILSPVSAADTPIHISSKLEEEKQVREAKRKEREEAHLFMQIRILVDEDFRKFQGFDLGSFDDRDPINPPTFRSYRILKKTTVAEFCDIVAKDLNAPPSSIRLWLMVNRQNKTVRPDQPIAHDDVQTLEEIRERHGYKERDLRFWAESGELDSSGIVEWPTDPALPNNAKIMLFLKHFDVQRQTLYGIGHTYVTRLDKVQDLSQLINQFMRWPASTQLKLFEEIKPSMIEPLRPKQTYNQAELQDGDIICFQRATIENEHVLWQLAS